MPTRFDQLYTAMLTVMTAISASSPNAVTKAETFYGTDFRITPGAAEWQIRFVPLSDYHRGTVQYPRVRVEVWIHHNVNSAANELEFLHGTVFTAGQSLLDSSTWTALSNVYDLEPDTEPEVEDAGREGNVISFVFTATVLLDPV